ncbi:DUF1868 domain-containing protein [Gymnodinialimonas hymeniacidonis]|uniref:DUF1868 domain-containing protein n=1 Tax=Gymnodinialimonas hymeniacidonis TaxID=3126508 RepID=UPI0034C64CD6
MDDTVEAFAESAHSGPPRRLGQRYDRDGFLPDPGNTVVRHLDLDAQPGQVVLAARSAMMALPGAERFLFTPVESLHMTIFDGVLDNRRVADAWPAWMDPDAPVEDVTREICVRLDGFEGPGEFAVRVAKVRPGGLELCGATEADEAVARDWREALSEAFGYRQGEHDRYGFHMTFAYSLDWLSDDLVPVWKEGLARIQADLVAKAPVVPLRPPAFCRFADMTRFEELVGLR